MKKRYFFPIISILFLLFVAGCSKETEADIPTPEPTPEQPEEPDVKPDRILSDDMILAEKTFLLTEDFIQHVAEPISGAEIILDSGVAENILPQKGDILLYGKISELFPSGFLGKVTDVVQVGSQYKIQTEPAALDEAFDKLYIDEVQSLQMAGEEEAVQSRMYMGELYSRNGYAGIKYNQYINFSAGLESDWKANNGWGGSSSASLSGAINTGFGIGFKLECHIDIDKKEDKKEVMIGLRAQTFKDLVFAINGGLNVTYEKELKKLPLTANLYPAGTATQIILNPTAILSFYVSFNGEFDINYEQHNEQEWMLYFEYKEGKPEVGIKEVTSEKGSQEGNSFLLSGGVGIGFKLGFSVKLFNMEQISASASLGIGPSINAEFPIPQGNEVENYYENFKDNTVSITLLNIAGECGFKVPIKDANYEGGYTVGAGYTMGKMDWPLFPSFENVEWDSETSTVRANVQDDLLIPAHLDYALFDENREFVRLLCENPVRYRLEGDFQQPFESGKIEKEEGKTYYVRPIVELPVLGKIKAMPEVKLESFKIVTMGDDYEEPVLRLMGYYNPEQCQPELVGVCYSTVNSLPTLSDQVQYASMYDEGDFMAVISNAQKNKIYYYRAFMVVEGKVYYGEVMVASTEEPDETGILGEWDRISYHLTPYVSKDDEDKYGEIPHWEIITYMAFEADHSFAAVYESVGLLHGNWKMPSANKLRTYVRGTGKDEDDEGESLYTIVSLTETEMHLRINVPDLYKMDAVYEKRQ